MRGRNAMRRSTATVFTSSLLIGSVCLLGAMIVVSTRPRYALVIDTERSVGLLRDGKILIGRLDEWGRFARSRGITPVPVSKPESVQVWHVVTMPRRPDELTYDYRAE